MSPVLVSIFALFLNCSLAVRPIKDMERAAEKPASLAEVDHLSNSLYAPLHNHDEASGGQDRFRPAQEGADKIKRAVDQVQKQTEVASQSAHRVKDHFNAYLTSIESLQQTLSQASAAQQAYQDKVMQHFIDAEKYRLGSFDKSSSGDGEAEKNDEESHSEDEVEKHDDAPVIQARKAPTVEQDEGEGEKRDEEKASPPPTSYALSISIIKASGLRDADWIGGKSDPFVVGEVPGKTLHADIQTPTIEDNLNPVWNYEKTVEDWSVGDPLKFTVYDSDGPVKGGGIAFHKSNDVLGYCELSSEQFYPNGFEGGVQLEQSGNDKAKLYVKIEVKDS